MTVATRPVARKPVRVVRESLNSEPISSCNRKCKMCYTHVVNGLERTLVDPDTMHHFVQRFLAVELEQVWPYWRGTGEVSLQREFPSMVNRLLAEFPQERLTRTIQTNGTVRRLKEFDSLQRLDFNVTIDGPRQFHEWQRGKNTNDRTLAFCRETTEMGCRSLLVRRLLTRDSIHCLDAFQAELSERIDANVKPAMGAPCTNRSLRGVRSRARAINQHKIDDAFAITQQAAREILAAKYQNRYELDEDPEAVDNYLSLTTYGTFSCCHGIIKLGDAQTDITTLLEGLAASERACRACSMVPCM